MGVPCVGLILTFTAIKCQMSKAGDGIPAELAKLKALGVPTEPADLQPNPPVTSEENAAGVYASIFQQLEAKKDSEDFKTINAFTAANADRSKLASVVSAIQAHRPLFADADRLLSMPRVDFKRDYSLGMHVLFPEYAHLKQMAKLQAARAKAEWFSGNRTQAIRSLQASFRLAEHASSEPTLIGQLVAIAISAINHKVLEQFIEDCKNDSQWLKKIETMLSSVRDTPNLRRAFGGELVIGRASLRRSDFGDAVQLGVPDPAELGLPERALAVLLSDPSAQKMFEYELCKSWRITFEQLPKREDDWNGLHQLIQKREKEIDDNKSISNIANRILFPVFGQAVDASARIVAERRLLLISLKLLQRRGDLAKDLKGYGHLAIDPFTNREFRMKTHQMGFKIWSLGPDRIDQGGTARVPGSTSHEYDLVLEFSSVGPNR